MFLLVSGRHVGAHTDGHQYGVSIQISINLEKKILRKSRIRKIDVTSILARVFAYLPSFISQTLDFIYWPVLIFVLIYFEFGSVTHREFFVHSYCIGSSDRHLRVYLNFISVNIHEFQISIYGLDVYFSMRHMTWPILSWNRHRADNLEMF